MVKVALPWALLAVFLALALSSWLLEEPTRDQAPTEGLQGPAEERGPATPAHAPQRPHAVPSAPSVPVAAPPGNESEVVARVPTAPECPPPRACPVCPNLSHAHCADSAVLLDCQAKVKECAAWDPIVTAAIHRDSVASARRATLETLLQEDLEISSEQVSWLREAACALRELRWHAVEQIHEEDMDSATPRLLIRDDRQEILADMEKMLGAATYARLREMGGIGLLNDTLECADQESGP